MADPSPKRSSWLWVPFALGMPLMMAGLAFFLLSECSAGSDAIEAYAATVRGGAVVSESVGGAEAAELTEVLGRTRTVSSSNFIAQAGTQCVWVTLHLDQGSRAARFVLAERQDGFAVTAASLQRECRCPIDIHERCRLE